VGDPPPELELLPGEMREVPHAAKVAARRIKLVVLQIDMMIISTLKFLTAYDPERYHLRLIGGQDT